jgi:hypothetical protein
MILKAPLQGGTPTILAANEGTTTAIAVDARNVYWVNYAESLRVLPKGGGSPITLTTSDDGQVDRLAIDESHAYFTTNHGVERVPLSGGKAQVLAEEGIDADGADAIALDDAYVYWIDRGTTGDTSSSLKRLAKSGGEPLVLAAGMFRSSMDLGLDTDNVYVPSMEAGSVLKVSKVGGPPLVLASGLRCPDTVRIDSSGIYMSNNAVACDIFKDDLSGRGILRMPQTRGTPVSVANAEHTGIDGSFAMDTRNIYWAGRIGPRSGIFCRAK